MTRQEEWINLLIDAAIARDYQIIVSTLPGRIPPVERADSTLVAGLLIRAVSILDAALEDYIDSNNLVFPSGIRSPKLYHRLQLLSKKGLLVDFADIDSWRQRRNDVGHEITEIYSWEEFRLCLSSIYRELNSLGILNENPALKTMKTIQRVVPPTVPGASIEQDITVSIIDENENNRYQFAWKLTVGGSR